jgi:hypothetical protein
MRRRALLGFFLLTAAVLPASSAAAGPLAGRWKAAITRADLAATGEVSSAAAESLYGPWTARFDGGRFQVRNERTGSVGSGSFVLTGGRVRFVFASGVAVKSGEVAVCTASVFRNRLTFGKVPGRPCLAWDAATWTRAG